MLKIVLIEYLAKGEKELKEILKQLIAEVKNPAQKQQDSLLIFLSKYGIHINDAYINFFV